MITVQADDVQGATDVSRWGDPWCGLAIVLPFGKRAVQCWVRRSTSVVLHCWPLCHLIPSFY
jgi:hypothetical protein